MSYYSCFVTIPPWARLRNRGGIVSYGEDGEPVSVAFLNASVREVMVPGEMSVAIEAGRS
jgi:hypothetical protein